MTTWLKQSTSVSVVLGPIWATADGALKADLAYNASGINCDIYKNGTKADVTLANSSGDGYFRAASGEALYLLTLSTSHTDTLGAFTISLSATGYYMKPQHYMVVPANIWDSMFGASMQKVDLETIKTQAITCAAGVTVRADVGTASQSTAQTGDSYPLLNTELAEIYAATITNAAGADVAADIIALKAVADILRTIIANKSIESGDGTLVTYRNVGDTADAGSQSWNEATKTRGEYTAA